MARRDGSVGSAVGRASSGASLRSTAFRRVWSTQARLATEVHHAAYDSMVPSWAAARATASAASSSASSRLPVSDASARTMRGQASANSPGVGRMPPV